MTASPPVQPPLVPSRHMSENLDKDELAVLAHAAAGLTWQETGAALGASERTVRRRVGSAADKLGTRGVVQTVAVAAARGLIDPEKPPEPASFTPLDRPRTGGAVSGPKPGLTIAAAIPDICAALPLVHGSLPAACDAAGVSYKTVLHRQKHDPELRSVLLAGGWAEGPGPKGERGPSRRVAAGLVIVLAELSQGATLVAATEAAGISAQTVHYHLDKDPALAERFEQAREEGREARLPFDRDDLLEAIADGTSLGEYASRISLSSGYLYALISDTPGLKEQVQQARATRRAVLPDDAAKILDKLRGGASLAGACAAAGVAYGTVGSWRARHPELDAEIRKLLEENRRRDPPWAGPLIAALEDGASFKAACEAAEVHFVTPYRVRRERPDLDARVRAAVETGKQRSHDSRWRRGDRDDPARRGHNESTRDQRRRKTLERFTPEVERTLLAALRSGVPLAQAAEQVGMTQQTMFGRARFDRAWAVRLDRALMAGRDEDLGHGTDYVYKTYKCRCPECREAHARYR